jgi:ribosomal-protein-alanine N-acetyltransferase
MQGEDLDEVMNIERISFSSPWPVAAFLSEISNEYSLAFVAAARERISGYICAQHVLDEGHILNLAVHPELRRKGIGNALAEETLDRLKKRGCRIFYLEVRMSNAPAMQFYEHLGFKKVGVRKKYYRSPLEDAALMIRTQ